MGEQSDNSKALRKLKTLIGDESFRTVMKELQGTKIYFSGFSGFISKEERDKAIWNDFFVMGDEVSEIALRYDLTQSSVYKIIGARCQMKTE